MLYVVYNKEIDFDVVRTESLLEAVQQATEIYDRTYDQSRNKHNDDKYSVQIIDMDEEEYEAKSWDDIKDHICSNSSLYQFITTYGVHDVVETPHENKSFIDNEVYHNLNKEEQIEVLHFIPDDMLMHELDRRMYEYRKYADSIRQVGEELKIYV